MIAPPVQRLLLRRTLDLGQFGILGQFVVRYRTENWVMEKALIGLVACETERHTAENIKKWTEKALEYIGVTEAGLLGDEEM